MRQHIVQNQLRSLPLTHRSTVANRLHALEAVDLTNVRRKLMEPAPEGKGWTEEQVLGAEKWYRRFLHLIAKYPDAPHVPNYIIDTFWHQHILDTRAYAIDCDNVFGHFIHHYPYFGLNGDAEQRDDAFVETNKLYMEEFGEDCTGKHKDCMSVCYGNDSIKAQGCQAPCTQEACGQGCSKCMVDVKEPWWLLEHRAEVAEARQLLANSCGHGGSGTGCGQGCSRGK